MVGFKMGRFKEIRGINALISALLLSSLYWGISTPLHAKMLDRQTCNKLSDELKQLKQHSSVQAMKNGFEWVKANVKPEDLQPIRSYIETEEQLRFRCKGKVSRYKSLPKTKPIKKNKENKKDKSAITITLPIKKPEGADKAAPITSPLLQEIPIMRAPARKS